MIETQRAAIYHNIIDFSRLAFIGDPKTLLGMRFDLVVETNPTFLVSL